MILYYYSSFCGLTKLNWQFSISSGLAEVTHFIAFSLKLCWGAKISKIFSPLPGPSSQLSSLSSQTELLLVQQLASKMEHSKRILSVNTYEASVCIRFAKNRLAWPKQVTCPSLVSRVKEHAYTRTWIPGGLLIGGCQCTSQPQAISSE